MDLATGDAPRRLQHRIGRTEVSLSARRASRIRHAAYIKLGGARADARPSVGALPGLSMVVDAVGVGS